MRVVSGKYRGRTLKAVPGVNTRPTSDKIKESLFNIIGPYFTDGSMLDMYAGSGGISIEAVSRGMERAVLIEKNRQALQTIRANIAITKEEHKFSVLAGSAQQKIKTLGPQQFSLVFLDPPYAKQTIVQDVELLQQLDLLTRDAIVVAEVAQEVKLPEQIEQLKCHKKAVYGSTALYIYYREEEGDGENSNLRGDV